MGLEGAFTKAKQKKPGGFGASKASRFGGPKESCEEGPSASAYQPEYAGNGKPATIGAVQRKLKADAKIGSRPAGFGSTAKRDAKILGQSNDAPGPGAYAEAYGSTLAGTGLTSAFASGTKKGLALNPSYGDVGPSNWADDVGQVKTLNKGDKMFGGAPKYEKPQEVVQADYAPKPGAFDAKRGTAAGENKGMGGTEPRGRPTHGQTAPGDVPGPGAYVFKAAFGSGLETSAVPTAAFADRTHKNPTLDGIAATPAPGEYEVSGDNPKFMSRSFAVSSNETVGFGSAEKRDAKILGQSNDAPGPGAYAEAYGSTLAGTGLTSAFASGTKKGLALNPSYGDVGPSNWADDVGQVKTLNKGDKMFGGAPKYEKPQEVVQADYAPKPGAFDAKRGTAAGENKGMGGTEPRGRPTHGQTAPGDVPGPGAYVDDGIW